MNPSKTSITIGGPVDGENSGGVRPSGVGDDGGEVNSQH